MMSNAEAEALRKRFRSAAHCAGRPGADRPYFLAMVDQVLDLYLSLLNYATEWDASEWGFDERWLAAERRELRKRAQGDRDPAEAV
jgi:hypothetical protein